MLDDSASSCIEGCFKILRIPGEVDTEMLADGDDDDANRHAGWNDGRARRGDSRDSFMCAKGNPNFELHDDIDASDDVAEDARGI